MVARSLNQTTICFIVIASWGSPSRWHSARYIVRSLEPGDKEESCELDCCSTIPIIRFLMKRGSVKRLIIVGLDSIVDNEFERRKVCENKEASKSSCVEAYCECLEATRCSGKTIFSYSDIIEHAKNIYECILKRLLERHADLVVAKDLSEALVAPATGSPGGRYRFIGDPQDFLSTLIIEIYRRIRSDDYSECDKIVVVLDTTHGINYMPTLTTKLSNALAQLIRIKYGVNTEIEIYNTDPYPAGSVEPPLLSINKVYEESVKEIDIPVFRDQWYGAGSKKETVELPKKDMMRNRELSEFIRHVVSALYAPAPLALLYACQCSNKISIELRETLDKLIREWKGRVSINGYSAVRNMKLVFSDIWAAIVADVVCSYISEQARIFERKPLSTANMDSGSCRDADGFNYDLLKVIGEELYGRVHIINSYLIKQELHKVEEAFKNCLVNGCSEYGALIVESRETSRIIDKGLNERNLVAHAGLLHNITYICRENNAVYLKYKDRDTVEMVFRSLWNIFEKRIR